MTEKSIERPLLAHETRVLGCLLEKQMTTPEYYPLTLKALTTACNQKSSRIPVMNLSVGAVGGVANTLKGIGLVSLRMEGRADRYAQNISRCLELSPEERAVLCVLMLRGSLTLNEMRINTGRMVAFENNDALHEVLEQLMEREVPLIIKIPHTTGRREDRFMHLLCGEPEIEDNDVSIPEVSDSSCTDRITQLEKEISKLKDDVHRLSEIIDRDLGR